MITKLEYVYLHYTDRYWGDLANNSGKMIGTKKSEEFFKEFGK